MKAIIFSVGFVLGSTFVSYKLGKDLDSLLKLSYTLCEKSYVLACIDDKNPRDICVDRAKVKLADIKKELGV